MPAIQSVRYTHDGMIDLIIAAPMISQGDIARHFGYSEPWVSIVINSDAFQARLAQRKGELIDPRLVASIEERLMAIAQTAADVVHREVVERKNPDYALKALSMSSSALGLGARKEEVHNNTYVAVLPAKAGSSKQWLERFAPDGVIDLEAVREGSGS